jgi:putative membrane protein
MFSHDGSVMGLGGISMWIFWLVLIVVLVLIVKAVSGNNSGTTHKVDDNPLDILKERYARGEIDDEEFNRRRLELEK